MRLSYALSIAALSLNHPSYATPSQVPNPPPYLLPRDAHAKNWSPPRAASPDPFDALEPPLQPPIHPETPPESQHFIVPPFHRLAPSWRPTSHGVGTAPLLTSLAASLNPFAQSIAPAHLPLPLPPPNGQVSQPIQIPNNPNPAIPQAAASDLGPRPRPRPHYSAPPRRNPSFRRLSSLLTEDSPNPHRQRGRSRERTPRFPRPDRSRGPSPPPLSHLQPRKLWDKSEDSPRSPRPHLIRPLPHPPPSNPFALPLTPPRGPSLRQSLGRNPALVPLSPISSPAGYVPDPPAQQASDTPVQLPPDPPVRPERKRRQLPSSRPQLPHRVYADEPALPSSGDPSALASSHLPASPPPHPSWTQRPRPPSKDPLAAHPSWAHPHPPSNSNYRFYADEFARSPTGGLVPDSRARRPGRQPIRRPPPRPRILRCAYLERFWRPPIAEWCYANMTCRNTRVVGVKRVRTPERLRTRDLCKQRCECV